MRPLDTPCLLVDEQRMMGNIRRLQEYADTHGLNLRPHIKTHKSVQIAQRQLAAGACGITCQKLGEAEVMAAAGCEDVLLTYNILGDLKLARLRALAARVRLATVADSQTVAQGLNDALAGTRVRLPVLVECDTGLRRCGVQSPAEALALAEQIDRLPCLELRGLMTYPPANATQEVQAWLEEAKRLLDAKGLRCDWVSAGNTPDMWRQHEIEVLTEIRCGTYVFNDRMMARAGGWAPQEAAATVLATVISRPTRDRALIDAGVKALSAERGGFDDYGFIVEYPQARIYALNEEHGYVRLAARAKAPAIGERIHIVPNHICVTFNLHERFFLMDGDAPIADLPIQARGRIQ